MTKLTRGLYESLLTESLAQRLAEIGPTYDAEFDELRSAEAADRIARHVAAVVERAVESIPHDRRAAIGIELARQLISQIAQSSVAALMGEQPKEQSADDPSGILRSIRGLRPDGTPQSIEAPLIPLLDTTLLTNSPGEPRVGHQIKAEIASADRIDLIMAFIRHSGLNPLREELQRHVEAGRALRVITTTYTGSTEADALAWLLDLGAQVRVSYDTTSTRLHAKAWLFHRESGFSTAYVGSSNLTHSAQVAGLEWNVRVSGARNRTVIDKIAAVFESYWQQAEFEPYDAVRFADATRRDRTGRAEVVLSPIEIRLEPFQERLLEQIELARQEGHHRNLLVSATGTGKTVMAAVDYARLRNRLKRARLLFVAHREEILTQSRATFAHALRDATFGEFWVGGQTPVQFDHVFGSIQSLTASGLAALDPRHFDVVIIDEFHHAAAATYRRILEHLDPVELLGLTATPERSDGLPVLHWFGGQIAAELRLWDAIDQHRLTPFAYYGIADDLDLRDVPWRRGSGYDVEGLTNVITASDVWARSVLRQFGKHFEGARVRALGFCVSVAHARYMARVFNEHGVRAVAVTADTPDNERRQALTDLAKADVNVVFSVDLFNEGVDVPSVDALLMLRPTESPLLFLQQLGRGLRKSEGKLICTVLDFVGQHRKEFRYDRRFQALLGGSRAAVARQVEDGFPFLPAGCHMELDRVASQRVLQSIRNSVPRTFNERAAELAALAAEQPKLTLAQFLDASGLELDDVYASNRSWSDLRDRAGLPLNEPGPYETVLRRACSRLLHVDDHERLDTWRTWLRSNSAPRLDGLSVREQRLLRMLLAQLIDQIPGKDVSIADAASLVWSHVEIRRELLELFDVLASRIGHVTTSLAVLPDVPLLVHARYTRLEILAACGIGEGAKVPPWQTGVYYAEELPADLFAFTLDKTTGKFSPTTRYRDYAISRELIHWESQSVTRHDSETGLRYQQHESRGVHVLLFARLNTDQRAFHFLGPATYVNHEGELPMAVTWRLHSALPGDLFQEFAAAVA
jgi:superfamily II DNA or RNA helicase/HKD family nuclease